MFRILFDEFYDYCYDNLSDVNKIKLVNLGFWNFNINTKTPHYYAKKSMDVENFKTDWDSDRIKKITIFYTMIPTSLIIVLLFMYTFSYWSLFLKRDDVTLYLAFFASIVLYSIYSMIAFLNYKRLFIKPTYYKQLQIFNFFSIIFSLCVRWYSWNALLIYFNLCIVFCLNYMIMCKKLEK